MLRYFACFVSKKTSKNNEPIKYDSLVHHYDIIHKNESSRNSHDFTEIEYYRTLSEARSMQKKLPGKNRGCLCS